MLFRIGIILSPLLVSCVLACGIPDFMRKKLEKVFARNYETPRNLFTRNFGTCKFPDGTTRNYTRGSDWQETPFPSCWLPIKYHVFTPSDKEATVIKAANTASTASEFEKADKKLSQLKLKGRPLFIICHGFFTVSLPEWGLEMKDELLGLGYNVILVQWFSAFELYNYAVADTRLVADVTAIFIDGLVQRNYVDSEQIVLVGFSLGAHIMGKAAEKANVAKIKAIIGLDPAGPFFDCHPHLGLSSNSAPFVQALHTDYKGILFHFGTERRVGDVDYFVNPSGRSQPGCMVDPTCSHTRAPNLMVQIIKSQRRTECNRIAEINTTSICELSAQSECGHEELTCIEDQSIKVISLWTLLGFTLKGEQPTHLGRFNVITSSKGDYCGSKSKITIKFSSSVHRDEMELRLLDTNGDYHGPFTISNTTAPAKKVQLNVLLPRNIEYNALEIHSSDKSVEKISHIKVKTKAKKSHVAKVQEKKIVDNKVVFPLWRKA